MHGANGFLGGLPADAAIGDRDAILQAGGVVPDILSARVEMALHHEAGDGAVAGQNLAGDVFHDPRLQLGLLAGIGVAAVHHDVGRHPRPLELGFTAGNVFGRVVRAVAAAPQHHVGVFVSPCIDDGGPTYVCVYVAMVGAARG